VRCLHDRFVLVAVLAVLAYYKINNLPALNLAKRLNSCRLTTLEVAGVSSVATQR